MRVHLFANGIRIRGAGVTVFDIELRGAITLELLEAPKGIGWFAKGDAVLKIQEAPDNLSAKIRATGVGTSIIHLMAQRGNSLVLYKTLTITVYQAGTTHVEAEFTNIRPKPQ